jgi:hypothetical protein
MKFRKKPVVIEAFKWTGDQNQTEDPEWIIEAMKKGKVTIPSGAFGKPVMKIKTLEGIMTAIQGDYIIQGIAGEIYPCRADIFEMTYQRADKECELCNGKTLEYFGDTISLDMQTLSMTTEGDFGETVVALHDVKYCPMCGKEIK